MEVLRAAAAAFETPLPPPDMSYLDVISVVRAQEPHYYTWVTGETATVAYRVKYEEDGDEEDMTQAMVLEHHLAYLEWKRAL